MVMMLRMTGRNQDDFSDEDYDHKNKQITAITAVHLSSVKLRVFGDPDSFQENTLIRIREPQQEKNMQNFICIPYCTEFYISQILQNHSATRVVFQIEVSKYEQTCAKKELLVY